MNHRKEFRRMFPWMAASFAIYFAIQVVGLIPAYVLSYIVDTAIPGGNPGRILAYILLFVSIPLLSGAASSYYTYITAIKCRVYAYDYNQRILDRLLRQSMEYLNANAGGELSAKAMQEVSGYVYLWICTIPQAAASVLAGVITLIAIGCIHPYIAAAQILFILLLVLPVRYGGKLVKQNSRQMFGAVIKGRAIVSEAFGAIRTIKTMCLESKILARYKRVYQEANAVFGKAVAVETVTTSGIRDFLSAVFLGVAFIQCAMFVASGTLSIGLLVTCISLVPRFQAGVVSLVSADLSFKKQMGQYDALLAYLDLQPESEGTRTPGVFLAESLRLENVSFAYDKAKPVLKNFSLAIPRGAWVGLEGRSGAGKSTAMDLLLRLYQPDSGQLLLDGVPAGEIDLIWYRRHIAYVPQEPFLFHGTIRENLD